MTKIGNLIENYNKFVNLPWQTNLSGNQRVWFAVYPPAEERRLREKINQFEMSTQEAKHKWHLIDLTLEPAKWLHSQQYREAYFQDPLVIVTVEDELKSYLIEKLKEVFRSEDVDDNTVVAVLGTGSLFGFTHISSIISAIDSTIKGRLLVFFPGEHDSNTYRFMDARDGFNYMAIPITCGERLRI